MIKKWVFLVDPHDYHALSEKMEQLINSPQLLDEMGEFSHNYVKIILVSVSLLTAIDPYMKAI